jgi:spermidine synthase
VQLCNILGNTAGAVVTGLVLLHWLGTALTVRLIGVVSLMFVLAALVDGTAAASARPKLKLHRLTDGACAFALLALLTIFPSNGAFWSAIHGTSLAQGAIAFEDRTGISLLRSARARGPTTGSSGGSVGLQHDMLFIAGHAQSRVPFLVAHGALGVLGAIVHHDPQDILIIGQGTGGTPIGVGVNPRTRHIHVVDILAPVFNVMQEAALRSGHDNLHKPIREYYSDPRYTRTVSDGRHLLLMENAQYDIIEADAISPITALSGQLYSTDFFRLAMSRLKPGGYMVQWAPTERTLASFLRVFPYVVRANFVLIGSASPIDFSHELLAAHFAGWAGEYLTKMGWIREDVFEALTSEPQRSWTPNDQRDDRDINTDMFPKDEFHRNPHKIDMMHSEQARFG